MKRELQPAMKLTVAVGGDERHTHQPLYQAVLAVLHEKGSFAFRAPDELCKEAEWTH